MRQGRVVILCAYIFCVFFLLKTILDHVKINLYLPTKTRKGEEESVRKRTEITREHVIESINNDGNVTVCPQILRQHIMEKKCSGTHPTLLDLKNDPRSLAFMLVDDRLKVIYCGIPKVGTTSWKTFLVRVAGAEPLTHQAENEVYLGQFGLRYLNKYLPQDITVRLDTYFKFMFVRHPLERLVSAFRDKIARFNTYGEDIKREIVDRIIKSRDSSTKDPKFTRITFDDFIKYVILKRSEGAMFDHHWETYTNICHPCAIKYDYIGKLETMDLDAENIISKFQSTRSGYQRMDMLNKKFSYSKKEMINFQTFLGDFGNVTAEEVDKILDIYDTDMSMFGYSFDKASRVTSCTTRSHSHNCC